MGSKRGDQKHDPALVAGLMVIGILLLLHTLIVFGELYAPGSFLSRVNGIFDLDKEYNIPTLINSLFFMLGGVWAIRLSSKAKWVGQKIGWLFFAAVFIYFALDELLIIHEQLAEPLRKLWDIQAGNPFFHAWVIPGIVMVGVLGVSMYILKTYHKRLAIFAGILARVSILAAGVIACEIIGTYIYPYTPLYRFVMIPLEEIFELTLSLLLWVHLRRLHKEYTAK